MVMAITKAALRSQTKKTDPAPADAQPLNGAIADSRIAKCVRENRERIVTALYSAARLANETEGLEYTALGNQLANFSGLGQVKPMAMGKSAGT